MALQTWSLSIYMFRRAELGYYTANSSYQNQKLTSARILILLTGVTGASASEMHYKQVESMKEWKETSFIQLVHKKKL